MSTDNSRSKVIDLSPRLPNLATGQDREGALIKSCRGLAQTRLSLLLRTVFDSADDSLFELAKKAGSGSDQQLYFDSMRELRKRREASEQLFQDQLTRAFLRMGVRTQKQPEAAGHTLALLDDSDMEEVLAVSAMIEKGNHRLAHHLYVLEQRLSVLVGGHLIESGDNPIGPKAVCEAFHSTLREQQLDVSSKVLILKLFDKHLMGGIDVLYEEVNEHLVGAGVLPQLKYPKAVRSGSGDHAKAVDDGSSPSEHQDNDVFSRAAVAEARLRIEIYNSLCSLLSARRMNSGSYVPPTGPAFAVDDLINALSLLQHQATAMVSEASDPWAPMVQIKQDLVGQLNGMAPSADQHHVAEVDEDTIDLVGMLFEFVLQDRNLPTRLQALLSRLQIPFLKCAILDKAMFAQKEHPARQLLDELAQAGLSWTEEGDKDGRFFDKVQSVVEALLHDFGDDVQIFQEQLEGFREFNRTHRKRAELSELRTAESAQGAERLMAARQLAAAEIVKRVDGKSMPDVIRYLLTKPWANVLVLTLLRQGQDSAAWKSYLKVADALVWSAQPKPSEAERARLRALAPELERALRQGLALVAFHEKDLQQLMGDIRTFHELQSSLAVVSPAPVVSGDRALVSDYSPSADNAPAVATEESFVAEIVRSAPLVSESTAIEMVDDEFQRSAQAITVGTWVEFRRDDGHAERAKLSWVSPISHKYLFVNRKGLKVADKTLLAMAAELRQGRAVILDDVPLFDRALDAIVERLKSTVQAPAPV